MLRAEPAGRLETLAELLARPVMTHAEVVGLYPETGGEFVRRSAPQIDLANQRGILRLERCE